MEEKELKGSIKIKSEAEDIFLEYYVTKEKKESYSLEIEKKIKNNSGELCVCEHYSSKYNITDPNIADSIAKLFAENQVTPVTADNILHDLGYKI